MFCKIMVIVVITVVDNRVKLIKLLQIKWSVNKLVLHPLKGFLWVDAVYEQITVYELKTIKIFNQRNMIKQYNICNMCFPYC